MHRVIVTVVAAAMLASAACGGGGDEPAPPAPTSTPTATASAATPEASPTATPENLTPAATATATPTPTPAVEAVTPITQHTEPTPAGTTPPAPATPTPTPPPAAGNPMNATVGVSGSARFFWSPAKVAIAPGGSVTWAWSGNDFHDVVVDALGYSSGNPVKQGSYTLTFPGAGTYAVSCSIHPDTMRGTVTVE